MYFPNFQDKTSTLAQIQQPWVCSFFTGKHDILHSSLQGLAFHFPINLKQNVFVKNNLESFKEFRSGD